MTAVILTIHSLIVIALIGVVLLQRSDGGALGIGGGGGGGFMTGRGAANALTRTTTILAAAFFATSVILAIRAGSGENADDVINELTGTQAPAQTEPSSGGELSTDDILNSLGAEEPAAAPETAEDLLNAQGVETPPAAADPEAAAGDAPAQSGGAEAEEETPNP